MIKRNTKLAIRIKAIKFSPDGTSFACASTEGLVIYSLRNDANLFNPVEIDETVTIDNIIANIKSEQYLTAILLALRMNEREITEKVFKSIPLESVPLMAANFPSNYLLK